MFKFINSKKLATLGSLAVLMSGVVDGNLSAWATEQTVDATSATGVVTPNRYNKDMGMDQTVSFERSVVVSIDDIVNTITTTNAPDKLDILFLADNTGSMGSGISNVQQNASSLLNSLAAEYNDIEVGVARYYGDPKEILYWNYNWRTGRWTPVRLGSTRAYQLQEAVDGGTTADAIAAINNWSASGGDDWPEANFFALHQAATSGASTDSGYSTGYDTNWRDDAKKIIVWFGDAKSHTMTVSQQEAIDALNDNDITVIAIHTTTTPNSVTNGLDSGSQASSITTATSGEFAAIYSSQLATTMLNLIDVAAVEEITTVVEPVVDLSFSSVGNTSGLNITYTCIDELGCEDVKNGETRRFKMEVTGNSLGQYNFDTIVPGVTGAVAENDIKVWAVD